MTSHLSRPKRRIDRSIGTYDSIASYLLPDVRKLLEQIYEQVVIRGFVSRSTKLSELLRSGKIDCAIGANLMPSRDIKVGVLFSDVYEFFAHPSLSDGLNAQPLIWFPTALDRKGATCETHLARRIGRRATLSCENMESVKELTCNVLGVGVMPRNVAAPLMRKGQLKQVNLQSFPVSFGAHDIHLARRSNLPPEVLKTIDEIIWIARSRASSASYAR